MQLSTLGYTEKWIRYHLLDDKILHRQLKEFEQGTDENTAPYRYHTFLKWLQSRRRISNQEIEQYLELAKEDADPLMAGNAIKELYTSPLLTEGQFKSLTLKLPEFGDWTKKLITREVLSRRLKKEKVTPELYQECLKYKKVYKDNRLLVLIISETDNPDILADFAKNGSGKRIRTLAEKKLQKIIRHR